MGIFNLNLDELVKLQTIKGLVHEGAFGELYISEEDFNNLNLTGLSLEFARAYLNEKNISIITPVDVKDRSKKVKDAPVVDMSEAKLDYIDKPRYAKFVFDAQGEIISADYTELDRYLENNFIPNNISVRRLKGDKYGTPYLTIQTGKITKERFSNLEIKHVMEYLAKEGIVVRGQKEELEQFENYDYHYGLKYIQTPKMITPEETLDYFRELKECTDIVRKNELKNIIINGNCKLADWVLYQLCRYYRFNMQEWRSEAYIALYRALEKFDVDYGCKFSTFAVPVIRNDLLRQIKYFYNKNYGFPVDKFGEYYFAMKTVEDAFNREYNPRDIEMLEELLTLLVYQGFITEEEKTRKLKSQFGYIEEVIDEEVSDGDIYIDFEDKELHETIIKVLATLDERYAKAIILKFGLDGKGIRSNEEIAKKIGYSEGYISQVLNKALRCLRHWSRSKHLYQYYVDMEQKPEKTYKLI